MWWLAVLAIWTLLAFMSASQTALFLAYRGTAFDWAPLIIGRLADWYTCAIFFPGFVWLAKRWPVEFNTWRRHLPIHLGASIVAVVLKYAIYLPIQEWLEPSRARSYPALLAGNALSELMIFWVTIAVIHAIEFYRRYREREKLALQLSTRLTRAQLDALRAQLRPHFLFNTLNAIATLIHRDAKAADAMIGRLADLLRASLQHEATHVVPLDVELGLARDYVGIMQGRFGDRLNVAWNVPTELMDVEVPAFVLQPLIENAFEHGLSRVAGEMHLTIRARHQGSSLVLSVTDNGPGFSSDVQDVSNVGLTNTRQRLEQLYGSEQSLRLESRDGETTATVFLPLRRQGDSIQPLPKLQHA